MEWNKACSTMITMGGDGAATTPNCDGPREEQEQNWEQVT
jgi:hypothetical protein